MFIILVRKLNGVLPPPNQNSKLSENKLHGAIGDINNVELSLHQLKSDIYENEPDTPTLYAPNAICTIRFNGKYIK